MYDEYKISRKRLENIADRVRVMAGLTRKMTPAEIVDWLSEVEFIPLGNAESVLSGLKLNAAATGVLPTVHTGTASSTLSGLLFHSTATGELTKTIE